MRRDPESPVATQRPLPFFTVGHSTRSAEEFGTLLRAAQVQLVVDVRHIPRSRTNPQFNHDVLPASLATREIAYVHLAELGGLRGKPRGSTPSVNLMWRNQSFRNYADYAMSEAFAGGLAKLRELGGARRAALMCAEALWWRCHRRIIADYLLCQDESVLHIMGRDRLEPARLTPGAVVQPDRTLRYPG